MYAVLADMRRGLIQRGAMALPLSFRNGFADHYRLRAPKRAAKQKLAADFAEHVLVIDANADLFLAFFQAERTESQALDRVGKEHLLQGRILCKGKGADFSAICTRGCVIESCAPKKRPFSNLFYPVWEPQLLQRVAISVCVCLNFSHGIGQIYL